MKSSNQSSQHERNPLGIDEKVKLTQAQMLLNVSSTMAALDTLDEMLATASRGIEDIVKIQKSCLS